MFGCVGQSGPSLGLCCDMLGGNLVSVVVGSVDELCLGVGCRLSGEGVLLMLLICPLNSCCDSCRGVGGGACCDLEDHWFVVMW